MYVRDCYKTIADQLLGEAPSTDAAHSGAAAPTKGAGDGFSTAQSDVSPLKCALILGPKGIGKTMFLNYLKRFSTAELKGEKSTISQEILALRQTEGKPTSQ